MATLNQDMINALVAALQQAAASVAPPALRNAALVLSLIAKKSLKIRTR